MNDTIKMKKNPSMICLLLLMLLGLPHIIFAKIKIKDLSPVYKKWLIEEVVYIITKKEKEIFLQLETNRERDLFIEAFWKQRDPIPETPENEYREEHHRRINYANRIFGRGTTKQGWKTDRGKIYIILGKPATSENYGTLEARVVPTEVWLYQGNYGSNVPSRFYVVFFQEEGIGDYILYSPVRHGPRKLLESYDRDPRYAIDELRRINIELANISRSLIPGEPTTDHRTSVSSELLLKNISVLPQKTVKDDYAEKLLKYKSIVEVDHSVNYVGNDAIIKTIKNKKGYYFVHYAVEPQRLSIGKYGNKYLINLEIFGKISDLQGKTIYQFQKKAPLNFTQDQIPEMKSKLFSFQDVFPLIPGHFKFDLLIKNTVSKEFTSTEKDIIIPHSPERLEISPLILSPKVEQISSQKTTYRPFQFGDFQIYPSASKYFSPKDKLFICFKIYGLTQDLKENGIIEFSFFKEDKKVHFQRKNINEYNEYKDSEIFIEEFTLAKLPLERYEVQISVLDANKEEILVEREDFQISPAAYLPRAWSLSEILPPLDDPLYLYILGSQLLNNGETEKAKIYLENAYYKKPISLDFALALANAYFDSNEYQKVQEILSRFLEKAKEEAKIYYLLGKSTYRLGKYANAIYFFNKYLSYFGTHLEILNSLGECYFQTGDIERALKIWKKSLEIEPKQEEVKKKIEALKKNE